MTFGWFFFFLVIFQKEIRAGQLTLSDIREPETCKMARRTAQERRELVVARKKKKKDGPGNKTNKWLHLIREMIR
jgi:hypothetical protein